MSHRDFYASGAKKKNIYFSEVPKTMLNLNIHTSYVSHSVNYSNMSHFGVCEIYVRPIMRF